MLHIPADFLHPTRDFVPESKRQTINFGNAGAIMRIRVTDSGSRNTNQNVRRSDLGNWNICILERSSDLVESHRSHFPLAGYALKPRITHPCHSERSEESRIKSVPSHHGK